MLKQDESRREYKVAAEAQRALPAGGAVPEGIDQQVHDTIEGIKLKLENLRVYLSGRSSR